MSGFGTIHEDGILNLVLRGAAFAPAQGTFLSLHTGDPGDSGANEFTGGGYGRVGGSWAASSGGTCLLNAAIDFTSMPVGTVTHFGVWNHLTAGTFVGGGTATNRVLASGDTYRLTTSTRFTLE